MLLCLQSKETPKNALAAHPRIARAMGLYFMCRNFSQLPDGGGVLDMRADTYAFFRVFGAAESEYLDSKNRG